MLEKLHICNYHYNGSPEIHRNDGECGSLTYRTYFSLLNLSWRKWNIIKTRSDEMKFNAPRSCHTLFLYLIVLVCRSNNALRLLQTSDRYHCSVQHTKVFRSYWFQVTRRRSEHKQKLFLYNELKKIRQKENCILLWKTAAHHRSVLFSNYYKSLWFWNLWRLGKIMLTWRGFVQRRKYCRDLKLQATYDFQSELRRSVCRQFIRHGVSRDMDNSFTRTTQHAIIKPNSKLRGCLRKWNHQELERKYGRLWLKNYRWRKIMSSGPQQHSTYPKQDVLVETSPAVARPRQLMILKSLAPRILSSLNNKNIVISGDFAADSKHESCNETTSKSIFNDNAKWRDLDSGNDISVLAKINDIENRLNYLLRKYDFLSSLPSGVDDDAKILCANQLLSLAQELENIKNDLA